jgi:hypothetical protein
MPCMVVACCISRLTTDRRILFFFTYLSGRQSLFLAVATADGSTTDRRILFFFTSLSGRRALFLAVETASRVDDGQTNSVLFHLSVRRAPFRVPSQRLGLTTDRTSIT